APRHGRTAIREPVRHVSAQLRRPDRSHGAERGGRGRASGRRGGVRTPHGYTLTFDCWVARPAATDQGGRNARRQRRWTAMGRRAAAGARRGDALLGLW